MDVDVLGPYELVEVLGRGGMGVVYRGVHRETGVEAAVKTVRVREAGLLPGIRREIHALARVSHPGVIRVLDEGEAGGVPWYAMELVRGGSARGLLGRPAGSRAAQSEPVSSGQPTAPMIETLRLPERTAAVSSATADDAHGVARQLAPERLLDLLTLARRIAQTLAYLHGEGIVHRDLKPDNVILRQDGTPVILDFGLAAQVGRSLRETLDGDTEPVGTPAYMAPEQGLGQHLDARADIYALGCMLYELLVGEPPFVGETPLATLQRRYVEVPLPPSARVEGIPSELDGLVLGMLARHRRERIGYASDVAAALERLGAAGWPVACPAARPFLYPPELFGRDPELRALLDRVRRLGREPGGFVLVRGESGVGKTRLMKTVAAEAVLLGVRVAHGESDPPAAPSRSGARGGALHPLRKLLGEFGDRLAMQEPGDERSAGLRAARLLVPFAPALGRVPGVAGELEPAELPQAAARQRLFRTVEHVVAGMLRERPLLLVLDDLQWADELTLELLAHWRAAGAFARELLVIGIARSEDADALERLAGLATDEVSLSRLPEEAVGMMAASMLSVHEVPGAFVRHLCRHSEGNPLFVAEYLRAAAAASLVTREMLGSWRVEESGSFDALRLPSSLADLVTFRLDRLPPAARQLADAASVIGRDLPADLLRDVTPLPSAAHLEALDALISAGIMEEAPAGYRFSHDKLREVAYQRLSEDAALDLHRRVAESIASVPEREEAMLPELARHWERCGERVRAREAYRKAALGAGQRYATDEAEGHCRAWLALCEPGTAESIDARVHLFLDVLHFRGRRAEALGLVESARADAASLGDPRWQVECLRQLGVIRRSMGETAAAMAAFLEARDIARHAGDTRLQSLVASQLAEICMEQGRVADAETYATEALALVPGASAPKLGMRAIAALAGVRQLQGRTGEARELLERALAFHRGQGDRFLEAGTLGILANIDVGEGRYDEALASYERAIALHREVGNLEFEAIVLGNFTACLMDLGRLAEAREAGERAVRLLAGIDDVRSRGIARALLGRVHVRMGNLEAARGVLQDAIHELERASDPSHLAMALESMADIHAAEGDPSGARDAIERAIRLHRQASDGVGEALAHERLERLDGRPR